VDYLAYRLVDSVIDHYFVALEDFGERLNALEEEVLEETSTEVLGRLHRCRRQLSAMRRAVWPARDAVNGLRRAESSVFGAATTPFLADVYDHSVQVIDTLESLRETALSLMDTRLALAGQRMNEIMKVLTMIATIFIPLGFMAGLYGMNFEYMPELGSRWAYPMLLALMIVVAAGMIVYFRRRGWLGRR
jgi:magnesium transporter